MKMELTKGFYYKVEILRHDRKVPNCMKFSQSVQFLKVDMRTDLDSSHTQDYRIFQVAWIDSEPNGRDPEADNW